MTLLHFSASDGARLAYRDEGEGLPLLALAGLTRDGTDFDYLANDLRDARLIRLDSRGRGGSEWTGADTYTVAQEAQDALALLDHLGIQRAAVIGSSRGGLLAMVMVAMQPARVAGICFNDVGPELERSGLERIGAYVGVLPAVQTLEEIADRMPAAMKGFADVPAMRWAEEAVRHYIERPDGLKLPYDPELKRSFDEAMAAPAVDLWPLYEACAGMPLALVRGANSDVLSAATARRMADICPHLRVANVPRRGHIPFLDEPEARTTIEAWLADVKRREAFG
ncbi:MAG: alpha/beta hydrolase [Stappia sp.]|uniref:alpha/beta fold hydrolase n=1 Tax=Stappia sp. TaxID=1870903 RepID=UPI000C632348|nr:alpha/beta hydrolase [Stappia sp.]MAA97730.1 alpha/beta hydrolase [Stappia sp.]MBM20654.1 alpha/beta hydrolase [Stappia sp.]